MSRITDKQEEQNYYYYCALCCYPIESDEGGCFADFRVIVTSLTHEGALLQVQHMVPLARVTAVFPIPVTRVPTFADKLMSSEYLIADPGKVKDE